MEEYKKALQKIEHARAFILEKQEEIEIIIIKKIKSIVNEKVTNIGGYLLEDNLTTLITLHFEEKEIELLFNEDGRLSYFEIRGFEANKIIELREALHKITTIR